MHSIVFNFMRKVQLEEIGRKRQQFIFGSNFLCITLSQSTRQPGGEGQEESATLLYFTRKGEQGKDTCTSTRPPILDLIRVFTCSQEWREYRAICNSLTLLPHILIELRQILFESKQRGKNSNRGLKKKDFVTRIDQNLNTEIIWEVLKYNRYQETLLIEIMV